MSGDATGSEELNVETAVPVFEAYLSEKDKEEKPETPPAPKAPEPEKPEPVAEEASTEPAETEEGESEQTDESPEEPQAEAPQTFTIKVNGEDVEVTLEELQKGYSRTADYTRKTQELSTNRKAFEAEATAVRDERQKYATQLQQLEQALLEVTPQEPDWATVQRERPDEFPLLWAQWSQHKDRMAAVRAEKERAEQAVQHDRAQQLQQHLEAEGQKLIEAIPEWKEPEKATAGKAKMVAYAKELGYTPQELENVTDHRVLVILHKAMQYDEAQKKKPVITQKVVEKIKVATPGPGKGVEKPPVTAQQKARQRLAKTGRPEDAASAFEMMLTD